MLPLFLDKIQLVRNDITLREGERGRVIGDSFGITMQSFETRGTGDSGHLKIVIIYHLNASLAIDTVPPPFT